MDRILGAWLEVTGIRLETLLTKMLRNVALISRSHLHQPYVWEEVQREMKLRKLKSNHPS
jgi:hypothetical protein